MPLCPRPGATFPFVLKTDLHKPKEQQPRFLCRFLRNEEWHAIHDKLEAASKDEVSDTDCYAVLLEVYKADVRGVENMGEFTIETVFEHMTDGERWDFAWNHLNQQLVTEDEWGKYRSQRASAPAPSATNAPAPASA